MASESQQQELGNDTSYQYPTVHFHFQDGVEREVDCAQTSCSNFDQKRYRTALVGEKNRQVSGIEQAAQNGDC